MTQKIKVAIAAGGTAGHINPALALAEELVSRGHEVHFFGQATRLEGRLVPEAGYPFTPIKVTGFDRSRPWTAATALINMHHAEKTVGATFADEGMPHVAIGFGAYIEMALLRWCRSHKVPYVLHEQNSVPGLANKLCAGDAATLCLSFGAAREAFTGKLGKETQVCITGNPVRRSVVEATREEGRAAFGVPEDAQLLLIFGGSLGAKHLNEGVVVLKDQLLSRDNLFVVHSTGADDFEETCQALALTDDQKRRWQVMPYVTNMGSALAAADLVLSRAGASSIAEIAALGVPSMLVPYPHATANHQMTNAHLLSDVGAAVICPDDAIDTDEFSRDLLSLVDDGDRREKMRAAAAELAQANAAATLADQVEAAAGL